MSFNEHVTSAKKRPVLTGLFAVLAVISTGSALAFTTGMTAPELAKAIIITPTCCTTVPTPVPVPLPPPTIVIPPPVVDVTPACCETTPTPPPAPLPPPTVVVPPPVIDITPPCCETVPTPTPPPPAPPTPVVTVPVVTITPTCCVTTPTPTPTPIPTPPTPVPTTPTPIPTPFDACSNLAGIQASVPSGYVKEHGICVLPPAPDVCPNIEGTQTSVPSGKIKDTAGNCVYPPTDVCPNLAGTQTSIPSGYVKDVHGSCGIPTPSPKPSCTLSVSPSSIVRGNTTSLSWSTQNATTVSLNQGLGAYIGSGQTEIAPTDTTTYVMNVSGQGGSATCSATVTVTPPDVCPNLAGTQVSVPSGYILKDGMCVPPPLDVCPNIDGVQADIPAGLIKDAWGKCVPPPVDVCPNLAGTQTSVPSGYILEDGKCVPPPVDVCPNLDGVQTSIPSGLIKDAWGKCVPPPPPDVCPNIAGIQMSIPDGYTKDAAGNCCPKPPPDVCPNLDGIQTFVPSGYTKDAVGNCVPPPPDVCPNIAGFQGVVPDGYTKDASGNCVKVYVHVPACDLSLSPNSIQKGGSATLSWSTQHANSFSINQGVGSVSPVAGGSRSVSPEATVTYTGTATGADGKTATCTASITVIQTPPPVCTLTLSESQIIKGGTAVLSWSTQNATTVSLNQGLGAYPGMGQTVVQPQTNTTYVLTAKGPSGEVTCQTYLKVVEVQNPPACTLTALPTSIAQGTAATLSWTTANATSASVSQGIGSITANTNGSTTVTPTQNTTYTLTAVGTNGQTITCSAAITVIVQPPSPVCSLSASPSSITAGQSVNLAWSAQNVTATSIDQGIGNVPFSGNQSVNPNGTITYTLTATGAGGSVTCPTTVTVVPPSTPPSCFLNVDPDSISQGNNATITWGGTNIQSASISQGIGSVGASGSRVIESPNTGTYTYTGTFTATNGQTLTCSDTLSVTSGGGGGSSKKKPHVTLEKLPRPDDQPFAFVYLDELPYTGLALGPVGTAVYWTVLVLFTGALAYLVLFNAMPFALRKVALFGAQVQESINVAPAVQHESVAYATHEPSAAATHGPAAVAQGYSSYDGFRSFAQGATLTIDDIVTGLAREHSVHAPVEVATVAPSATLPTHAVAAPEYVASMPAAPSVAERALAASAPIENGVPHFVALLLNGDKDAVFAAVRDITRTGGDSEGFLTQVVCALDEAYRSKIDGTHVHPEIAQLTASAAPAFLEKVVTALTTAVDTTYSTGVTGVKLALTRALAIING